MNINKNNSDPHFCFERIEEVKSLIDSSTSTCVIGVPGVGISIFLKYLSTLPLGHFIYIDVFGLPNLTSYDLFKTLLTQLGGTADMQTEEELVSKCRQALEKMTQKNEKVIICFGGFDQLKKYFDQDFFHHLRSLRNIDQKKVVFVFGICKRIDSLFSADLMDTDLHMLSSLYYLKPYSYEDLVYLLSLYGPYVDSKSEKVQQSIHLSGGHFQLLQLLLRSERVNDPLHDPFIKLAMRNIYQHLTYQQKKIIKKVATEGMYATQDNYLTNVGLIIQENSSYKLFSPLFAAFVKSQNSSKLPAKEATLFALLKRNLRKTVSKNEIFETVWENDVENASDWALDALVYRLRRHHAFLSQGYVIENHKKQGYMLLRNE